MLTRRGSAAVRVSIVAALLLLVLATPSWAQVARVQADWDFQAGSSAEHVYASGLTMTAGNMIELVSA